MTDDTTAIQTAESAAARAGGGVVRMPRGKCLISTGIAWDSNVTLQGAGMNDTTLVASRNFGFDPTRVRRGNDGQYIGMIWLDGPIATGPLRNVTIRDIGFDPRAGKQSFSFSSIGTYHCIVGYLRPLQHFRLDNIRFELGANARPYMGTNIGPKGFIGFNDYSLGIDPANPSFDLNFHHIVSHNGSGTIQMALEGTTVNGITSSAHDIRIDDVESSVDQNYIDDDRVVLDGVSHPAGGQLGRISNVFINNVTTTISDSVSVGAANALKINPATNTIVSHVRISNIHYRGSRYGAYGAPLGAGSKNGSGVPLALIANAPNGFVRDVIVQNIAATNANGILVGLGAEPGASVNTVLQNITLLNCYAGGAAIDFAATSPATGRDRVILDGFRVSASPTALAAWPTPIGVYFIPHAGGAGLGGTVQLKNGLITGYPRPVTVLPGFDGLELRGVRWNGGSPLLQSAVRVSAN
ncbi:MAG: hypothetical protein JO233_08970 [Candidatus Eremiobacteraeota bacterium]|nr:hypothetical protein [Candidatus Eremiobacteraeota bacterium]